MHTRVATGILLVLPLGAAAHGAVISTPTASLNLLGPTVFNAPLGDGTLITSPGVPDQLYKYCWYYRTQFNNTNWLFSGLDTPVQTINGNSLTLDYTNAGPGVAGQERFNARFVITLDSTPIPNQARVTTRLAVTNICAAARTIQLIQICDLDLAGGTPNSATDDTARIAAPGVIRQTEASSSNYAEIVGVGASRVEVDQGFAIRTLVNGTHNSIFDLPVGTSFAGDAAAALQWTITLAPGETREIVSAYSINLPALAPTCPCVADFDASGGTPDAADIVAYFNSWLDGAPAADADCSGGTPDATDVDAFFRQWLAGGC